jgi:hypothetical protein
MAAYYDLTGHQDVAIFSGWGDLFNEAERAVIEKREPHDGVILREASDNWAVRQLIREAEERGYTKGFDEGHDAGYDHCVEVNNL